ncbi:hypothetical protein KP78_36810 [Jeotgalibacillus soli]|uniref:Uncharacterized protein n=1 Tax=Jeotgalibacillus soli TaxID=889306 RepID=A0A0C2V497_9BACL|nr:hypothetical protein KP78_36810 [Jeotgalibacillus soli]
MPDADESILLNKERKLFRRILFGRLAFYLGLNVGGNNE